jgi:hypothetical protein
MLNHWLLKKIIDGKCIIENTVTISILTAVDGVFLTYE